VQGRFISVGLVRSLSRSALRHMYIFGTIVVENAMHTNRYEYVVTTQIYIYSNFRMCLFNFYIEFRLLVRPNKHTYGRVTSMLDKNPFVGSPMFRAVSITGYVHRLWLEIRCKFHEIAYDVNLSAPPRT
jgi:hypothetical protein